MTPIPPAPTEGPQEEPTTREPLASPGEAAGSDNVPTPTERIAELENQLRQTEDQLLRAQAELENFRKRAAREMANQRRYAALPLLRDLLEVVDNLQLAIRSAEQNHNAAGLLEGVKMVARQLHGVFEQHHCTPIDAAGQSFDPNFHEAVAHQPSDEHPDGRVVRVTRVGYQLHDRVVRPSQVHVSSGPAAPSPEASESDPANDP